MAARSIASLSLSFGLVNIPVRLFSATESSESVKFNMLSPQGHRVQQQYVSATTKQVVERGDMVKGYEVDEGQFVIFSKEELAALDASASHTIEMVAFLPERSIDPVYFEKAYLLAPDKRGGKPYSLLNQALLASGKCALARFTMKGKQHTAQIRATVDGLVLQQLFYQKEIRSIKESKFDLKPVSDAEVALALQLIEQGSRDSFDASEFVDEERQRILDAIDRKIAGKEIVEPAPVEAIGTTGQVIDLVEALRASLAQKKPASPAPKRTTATAEVIPAGVLKERKPAKRATKVAEPAAEPVRARARK